MLKKRIFELEKRIQNYHNKTLEIQESLKGVRKKCDETINKLGNKNLELLWKIDSDKELLNKLIKLPPNAFIVRKKTRNTPILSSIIEEDSGKGRKKSMKSKKSKRKSRKNMKNKTRSKKTKSRKSRKSKKTKSRKSKKTKSRKSRKSKKKNI
jgi:hypothetical protein